MTLKHEIIDDLGDDFDIFSENFNDHLYLISERMKKLEYEIKEHKDNYIELIHDSNALIKELRLEVDQWKRLYIDNCRPKSKMCESQDTRLTIAQIVKLMWDNGPFWDEKFKALGASYIKTEDGHQWTFSDGTRCLIAFDLSKCEIL